MSALLLISGLSGAGKSTALHALEDQGFFCTDNLPLDMVASWVSHMEGRGQPAALCLDARSCRDPQSLRDAYARILAARGQWSLLFLEASDEALQRRYSAVKRRHPFARDASLPESIARERAAMRAIRDMADLVLDTSNLSPYELAERVDAFWDMKRQSGQALFITVASFSYRRGIPMDADMVVDVRFLPNPHWEPELAALTGKDQPVIDYFHAQPDMGKAERLLNQWLAFAWPRMQKERKRYFTLAFGCTGGRHRSVYLAERAAAWLRAHGVKPMVYHRELEKVGQS
ncbi:MAG: RNase adapter RapZ [Zetaproteobacteria bacterium]|nr:MAG: RNase adapter RapZ [Zetaproteobacteria bacterium]